MAKFYGKVGYAERQETAPGVWEDVVTERNYYGDVLRNTRRLEDNPEKLNDDIAVTNTISIVADAYAHNHFFMMKYLFWQGAYWKVSSVEVKHPRLELRLGGLYHGDKAPAPDTP